MKVAGWVASVAVAFVAGWGIGRGGSSGESEKVRVPPPAEAAKIPDASQDRLDGLTVDLGDWWFNLRPSNTEPLLRLNLEARTRDECDEHTSELLHLITKG